MHATNPQTQNGRLLQQAARPIKGEKKLALLNVEGPKAASNSGTHERRASAWLAERIREGAVDRFCEIKAVSPVLAEEMLKRNTKNRPAKPARIAKYVRVMQEGRWKLTMEGLGFDTEGVLQNGQHRLRAVIQSGVTCTFAVWFGLGQDEFAFLDQGGGRTGGDLVAIEGLDYWNVRAAVARHVLNLESGERHLSFDAERVRTKAVEMANATMTVALKDGSRIPKIVNQTTGTLAYWWIASRTRRTDLSVFWESLSSGAGLESSSPILKVRDLLTRGQILAKNSIDRNIKEAAAIILAWNAYVARRRRGTFPWPHTSKLPDVL